MRFLRLPLFTLGLLTVMLCATAQAQTTRLLVSENFNATPQFKSVKSQILPIKTDNQWVVNQFYTGNGTYPNTPAEPGGSVSNPNLGYLHITDTSLTSGSQNAVYDPTTPQESWTIYNGSNYGYICTYGQTDVTLSFFWLAGGLKDVSYGEIWYSPDGGLNWKLASSTSGRTRYYGAASQWNYEQIAMADFNNKGDLMFAIHWITGAGDTTSKSNAVSFAIDDFFLSATDDTLSPVGIDIVQYPTTACMGDTLTILFRHSQQLCDGTYLVELSDLGGTFSTDPNDPNAKPTGICQTVVPPGNECLGDKFPIFNFQTGFNIPDTMLLPSNLAPGQYKIRVWRMDAPRSVSTESNFITIQECLPVTYVAAIPQELKPFVTCCNPANPLGLIPEPDTLCRGSAIDIPFGSNGSFLPGNEYVAELVKLDPVTHAVVDSFRIGGLVTSQNFHIMPSTISGTVPLTAPPDTGYHIRIRPTRPNVPIPADSMYMFPGKIYGGFPIRCCQSYLNYGQDIQMCVSSKKGADSSFVLKFKDCPKARIYDTHDTFRVQLCTPSGDPYIGNTFDIGWAVSDSIRHDPLNGDSLLFHLHIPRPDFPNFGDSIPVAPGNYYLRIISKGGAAAHYDTLSQMIRFRLGYPRDTTQIVPADPSCSKLCADQLNFNCYYSANPLPSPKKGDEYNWWINGSLSSVHDPGVNIRAISTTVIQTQEVNFGCPGPISDPYTIVVDVFPAIANQQSNSRYCQGSSNTLTVKKYDGDTQYNWSFQTDQGGAPLRHDPPLANDCNIYWDSVGAYTITVTATNSCGSSQAVFKDTVLVLPKGHIDQAAYPTAMYNSHDSTVFICPDAVLNASASVSPPGLPYTWYVIPPGTTKKQKKTTPTFQYPANSALGDYTVFLFYGDVQSGCYLQDTAYYHKETRRIPTLVKDTMICPGSFASLWVGNINTAVWSPGTTLSDSTSLTPTARPVTATTYTLKARWQVLPNLMCTMDTFVHVNIKTPTPFTGPTVARCVPAPVALQAPDTAVSYSWQSGEKISNVTVADTGHYSVVMLNPGGTCVEEIFWVTTQAPSPVTGPVTLMCPPEPVTLLAPDSGVVTYRWQTGDSVSSIVVRDTGHYTVLMSFRDGSCVLETLRTEENCEVSLWVPNVFTPNNDGENDRFHPQAVGITEIKLLIYNRWGNKVFDSKDLNKLWDGRLPNGHEADPGVYFYTITGKSKLGYDVSRSGSITLMR